MSESFEPTAGDALIVVDVQNDFLPGGSLAVAGGDEIVPVLDRCVSAFLERGLPVYATRDWHTPDHCSFAAQGGPWPPHCVAGTEGAAFAPGLELPAPVVVVSKATTREKDAYSGFQGTDLAECLRAGGVRRVFVGGIATDVCVLETVRDARAHGFDVVLLEDAIRAVDANPGDGERAIREMHGLGAAGGDAARIAAT